MSDDAGLPVPPEVLELFDDKLRIGYLGTLRPDGHLSVVPVGVMLRDGHLCVSTRSDSRKIANLANDPHITVCVVHPDDNRRYVNIRGIAEVTDDEGREFVDWLARTHMGHDEYPYEPRTVARSVIRIRPVSFTMPRVHGSSS